MTDLDAKSYRRRLLAFLGVATFFEGFDQMALAQLLPSIGRDYALDELAQGALVAFVNVGTILAYVLVRHADAIGRRPVLQLTIVGYTVTSFLSGLAPNVWIFAVLQLASRVFLIGEWVISTVYAAEEFPAEERGFAIGLINAFSSLGAVVCAGAVPLILRAPWGWRTVYFLGTVPLILLAVARRGLRESARFEQARHDGAARIAGTYRSTPGVASTPGFLAIWSTPYAPRVLQLATIWFFTYLCTQTAITFFKSHAIDDLGRTEAYVGQTITVAAVVSMPMVFAVGKLFDRMGRRRASAIIFIATALGCIGAYISTNDVVIQLSAVLAVFGAAAVLPALNAFNTELFPTELRSDAFAWANNLLGRIGYVLAPLGVGLAASSVGWGPAVAATAFGPLLALALIWRWLPETANRELEDTARLDP